MRKMWEKALTWDEEVNGVVMKFQKDLKNLNNKNIRKILGRNNKPYGPHYFCYDL